MTRVGFFAIVAFLLASCVGSVSWSEAAQECLDNDKKPDGCELLGAYMSEEFRCGPDVVAAILHWVDDSGVRLEAARDPRLMAELVKNDVCPRTALGGFSGGQFYAEVVTCTEELTGLDFGDTPFDELGFLTREASETINMALEAEPVTYLVCWEQVFADHGHGSRGGR